MCCVLEVKLEPFRFAHLISTITYIVKTIHHCTFYLYHKGKLFNSSASTWLCSFWPGSQVAFVNRENLQGEGGNPLFS